MSDLDEIEKLARLIDDFDSDEAARLCDENNEPPVCVACNGEYRIVEYGLDPTALDDGCAHEVAAKLARALLAVMPVVKAAMEWHANEREINALCESGRPAPVRCRQREWQTMDAMRHALSAATRGLEGE